VARAASRKGGPVDCGHRVRPGEAIVNVDVGERGSQTKWRNGRGARICDPCATSGLTEGTLTEDQPA
jgi:hypothetical protein